MIFKNQETRVNREYRAKMEKINRQLSNLEKLAAKYQACAKSAAQK